MALESFLQSSHSQTNNPCLPIQSWCLSSKHL